MGTQAKTDHTRCTFTIKEHGDGTPWIMIEQYAPGIPALKNGFIGLTLRPGVTFEQAKEIARELNENFEGISYTQFLN
jgi:hypothetical protein